MSSSKVTLDYQTKEVIAKILSPLSKGSSTDDSYSGIFGDFKVVNLNPSIKNGYLLKFILVDILNYPYVYMPMEKVEWEIFFSYLGVNCTVTSQKFGYRLYINSNDDNFLLSASNQLSSRFKRAIKLLDGYLKNYSLQQIKEGNLVISSQLYELEQMYIYLKKQTLKAGRYRNTKSKNNSLRSSISDINYQMIKSQNQFYLEQATYFAFFGLLEHLLVLLLAFVDFDPQVDNIKEFVFKPWSEKYKRVFELSDEIANTYYTFLLHIAREYRNLYAHGKFNKENNSFYFLLDDIGYIHANFSNNEQNKFDFYLNNDVEAKFSKIDEFLNWLRLHPRYKVPMQIIDSHLPINFSEEVRNEYKELIKNDNADEFIQRSHEMQDRHDNMDW